jgi:hypothetical protein
MKGLSCGSPEKNVRDSCKQAHLCVAILKLKNSGGNVICLPNHGAESGEGNLAQGLCEAIRSLFGSGDVDEFADARIDSLAGEMIADVNVTRAGMILMVGCQGNCSLIVSEDRSRSAVHFG